MDRTKEDIKLRMQRHQKEIKKCEDLLKRWDQAPLGVGHPEGVRYRAYMVLKTRESTASELASELFASYESVLSRLNELEQYGYIECVRVEKRGRMNRRKYWRAKECALPAAKIAAH